MMQASRPCQPAFVHHGGRTDTPVVLGLPAMGAAARYYEPFAQALAAASGATVAFADLRGQGDSPCRARDGHDFGYREIVEDDLPALVDQLGARHPGRPLVLLGHSLGGQLAAMAAHQFAERLAGIALIAAGTEELLGKLASASVTRTSMDGVRENARARRHFSWARHPNEAVGHVAHWLQALPG